MTRPGLLVVDDEADILEALQLTFEKTFDVFSAGDGEAALRILAREESIAVIIADQRMPGMTGVELLERSMEINPHCIRIILTGYTETRSLIAAINCGHIFHYITKPWNRQELKIAVQHGLERYELERENRRLVRELEVANDLLRAENIQLRQESRRDWDASAIIGESRLMREVFTMAERVMDNAVSVLLTGETGTGKTLLARFIHAQGPRRDHLFAEQNCGALPEMLLESELFGHRRGSFTGATQNQTGLFEAADGGTVFLDEISEMSPSLQTKLLQVLQDGRYRRLGESNYRQVDVRVIAATNRDLREEIRSGRFREDLYYRIAVFPIHIPPLRERREDIPQLARFCLHKHGQKLNGRVSGIAEEAMAALCAYDYPGNVRELENLIERALLLAPGDRIELGNWLPASARVPTRAAMAGSPEAGTERREDQERREMERVVALHRGNLSRAAEELGMSRTTLWRRMRQLGGELPEPPEEA